MNNMQIAMTRGDLGIERAADKAERNAPGWVDDAVDAIRLVFARFPTVEMTVEVARTYAMQNYGFKAPEGVDLRAWGQVTRRAVKLGYIERVPDKFQAAASSNCSPKPVYRAKVARA